MQFHILSFEGPDGYARAGGLATRVEGLSSGLAMHGFETHLWFVGEPEAPGHELARGIRLHRWCQWLSRAHPAGVYAGEAAKVHDYATSLPPWLHARLEPHLRAGGHAVVLAEEWQTADALLHLDWLLRSAGLRERVTLLWNANNTFGFDRIDWGRLRDAATVTTVSRYMKHLLASEWRMPSVAIPNGIEPNAFVAPEREAVAALRRKLRGRTSLVKMARFDPAKRWLDAVAITADMRRLGWRPLLIARGDSDPHRAQVLAEAAARGLRVETRGLERRGASGIVAALDRLDDVDVLELGSHVDPVARKLLFHAASVVLANSEHEPFGLVGLEAMAVGGLACTGSSGEDYALAGRNALVLETHAPREFLDLYEPVRRSPEKELRLRSAARRTARDYAWREVIEALLLPRVEMARATALSAPTVPRP